MGLPPGIPGEVDGMVDVSTAALDERLQPEGLNQRIPGQGLASAHDLADPRRGIVDPILEKVDLGQGHLREERLMLLAGGTAPLRALIEVAAREAQLPAGQFHLAEVQEHEGQAGRCPARGADAPRLHEIAARALPVSPGEAEDAEVQAAVGGAVLIPGEIVEGDALPDGGHGVVDPPLLPGDATAGIEEVSEQADAIRIAQPPEHLLTKPLGLGDLAFAKENPGAALEQRIARFVVAQPVDEREPAIDGLLRESPLPFLRLDVGELAEQRELIGGIALVPKRIFGCTRGAIEISGLFQAHHVLKRRGRGRADHFRGDYAMQIAGAKSQPVVFCVTSLRISTSTRTPGHGLWITADSGERGLETKMEPKIFQLFMGAITLAAVCIACHATWRRHIQASFYLMAAGLLGIAFFATIPGWPLAAIGVSALLTVVGFILGCEVEEEEKEDVLESSLTRRR